MHLKPRCPLQKKANKVFAMTCGYGVDGLGFYYIPHQSLPKHKSEHNAAIIRVVEGTMSADQVAAELERLVPGSGKWEVLSVDNNTFKMNFQSKTELRRMIEWGILQTKDRLSKLSIEECSGGSCFKQALRNVWVQMTGLPGELREFLTVWTIGTILGVTKDVDMKFMWDYERARFQVMVLDPSLIPHSIDVVIREYIYELHLRVEHEDMLNLVPIDMDDDVMDDRGEEDGEEHNNDPKPIQQDHSVQREGKSNSSAGSTDAGGKSSQLGKKLAFSIPVLDLLQHAEHGLKYDGDEVAMGGKLPTVNHHHWLCKQSK
jgi:hypothetical protein